MNVRYAVDFQDADAGGRFQLSNGTFEIPAFPRVGELIALNKKHSLHMSFLTRSGGLVSDPDTPILWGRVPSAAPFDYETLWDKAEFHPFLFTRIQCNRKELTPAEIIRLQEQANRIRDGVKFAAVGTLAIVNFAASAKALGGEDIITSGAELIRHLLLS